MRLDAFFDDLAHLERIISVSGIQIEATSQETQCLATTFRFLDEAEANEAAAAAKKGAKKVTWGRARSSVCGALGLCC